MSDEKFLRKICPEVGAGGYSSLDGTIEFYGRVQALLDSNMRVLDLGAGRGAWFEDDDCQARKATRLIKGRVKKLIGCDIDPVVLENRSIDEAVILQPGKPMPLDDASVDLIVSDYVLEHVHDVPEFAGEISRILKTGGWFCARTPTKYSYVAIFARLVSNRQHAKILKYAQPSRKISDVFPTAYRLNSLMELSQAFPADDFENYSYLYSAEPAYHFSNVALYRIFQFAHWLLPKAFSGNLYIFLHKK